MNRFLLFALLPLGATPTPAPKSALDAASVFARMSARYGDGAGHAANFTQTYTPAGFATARREMGTITMVDGSHLWKEPPGGDDSARHFARRDREELEAILAKSAEFNGARVTKTPMVIPKGHMSFHHCRIYHGSQGNRSDRPRRAISLHMQDGDNQWRLYRKPDGGTLVYNNDVMVRKTAAGAPDYADPTFCPVTWTA